VSLFRPTKQSPYSHDYFFHHQSAFCHSQLSNILRMRVDTVHDNMPPGATVDLNATQHLLRSDRDPIDRQPLTSFTLLPKLPKEIQYMIWAAVPQTHREIKIATAIRGARYDKLDRVHTSMPIPPLLLVCQDGRKAALKSNLLLRVSTTAAYINPCVDV
jgi:hypothetical protein